MPEEARVAFAACSCVSALLAAAVLGVVRVCIGEFGAMDDCVHSVPAYIGDQACMLLCWLILFIIGMMCSTAPIDPDDVQHGAISGWFLLGCVTWQALAYFGVTALVLLYRHLVMYAGIESKLADVTMRRKAARRIDWEIGSSAHVQELEDEYATLKSRVAEIDHYYYTPYRFEVKSWRFTASMFLIRVAAALAVGLSMACIGGVS